MISAKERTGIVRCYFARWSFYNIGNGKWCRVYHQFARAKEAVQRLATTDKVEYFGNLIRNGYLQGKHIDGSIFDEYIHILNTMSYREIQYLVEYKKILWRFI